MTVESLLVNIDQFFEFFVLMLKHISNRIYIMLSCRSELQFGQSGITRNCVHGGGTVAPVTHPPPSPD